MQTAEQNLNYVLLLKNLLDVVPELEKILLTCKSDLLCKIQKVCPISYRVSVYMYYVYILSPFLSFFSFLFTLQKLRNDEFRLMREKIVETVHSDARSVTGYTSSNMQRCFAIKAGINDLLDIARQTYCELIDDMKSQ